VAKNDRTQVTRLAEYQVRDREALHQILDQALVAHLGVVRENYPVVLPFACARDGDSLLLHGSTGGGMLRLVPEQPVCVEVTHVDGLVFARSLFESSIHYRSAVIFGVPERLTGEAAREALAVLSEHLMPGRSTELRDHSKKELAATMVLRVALTEWSLKVGRSEAHDPDDGESRQVWAGTVPFWVRAGDAQPAPDVPDGVVIPPSVGGAINRFCGPPKR
jgi:uncharacterized protein